MAVALKEGQVFVKRKHELADLFKKLDKASAEALDLLLEIMNDPKETRKNRSDCARVVLDYTVRVADQMDKSELTRQIAEIKVNGKSTPLVPEDEKPKAPMLDMSTIQSV